MEILAVLVIIGILAGVGYAASGHYRARAAEAEMRQDLVHFVNQQQVFRQRTGTLGTLAQLEDLGFRRSPGVVVEEDRVEAGGRRAYLRVKHRKTGQHCSVDYSPFVSNALNRVQCWAGEDDDSPTERVATGEPPATTPVTTLPVDSTITPPRTPLCEAGVAPTLEAPTDRTLRPGATGTGVFTLRNPGTSARSYSLGFSSSNPAVVPSATGPGSVTVPAGGAQTVTATFQVDPGAQAGQVSVLPLEATDTQCPQLAGNGFFTVAADLVLGPLELFAPGDLTVPTDASIPVVWMTTSYTNAPRMMVLEGTREDGLVYRDSAALGRQAHTAGLPRMTRVVYALEDRVDGFEKRKACAVFYDADLGRRAPLLRDACFTVTAQFRPGKPQLTVPASRRAGQDEVFTAEWRVANTSNAKRPFTISVDVTGDLQIVSATDTGRVEIPRGATYPVRVTYRLKRPSLADTESRARLRVQDAEGQYVPPSSNSAEFVVTTKLEVCAPTVLEAPASRGELPGASFSATWRLKNCTNAPRDLTLTPRGDADVTVAGAAGTERFTAFEERSISVPFRVKDQSVYRTESNPALQAADAGLGTPSSIRVTTALRACAPLLSGPAGVPAQPQLPGTGATVTYRVENCTNDTRTFTVPVASTNAAAVSDPDDPAEVTIAPYKAADVTFAYSIPAAAYGGVPADLAVRAQDTGDGSLFADDRFTITPRVIRAAPVLSGFPSLTVLPKQNGSPPATIESRSNVAVRYCFTAEVGAGTAPAGDVVSPSPVPPPCVDIATPFGTATISQPLTVAAAAQHLWTNQVTVTAIDQADAGYRAAQPFTVTAGLLLANPTIRVPPTPPEIIWNSGSTRSISYEVGNQANGARTVCITVSTTAPASLKTATPDPMCASIGAGESHTFVHPLVASGGNAEATVSVRAYDSIANEYNSVGQYLALVKDFAPMAVLALPQPIYTRKWFVADGNGSYSPSGTPIVKYIWTWGLPNMHWDGVRFVPGGSSPATDSSSTSRVQRAYDTKLPPTAEICLVVVDAEGRRSKENCVRPNTVTLTRARLQWRYRGWWYDPKDFCWDVPWDNQCPKESGNARWEVLLNASQGDVPIRRAWTTFRIDYWQTDDRFERTYSYTGNDLSKPAPYRYSWGGETRTYDFLRNDQKASGSVESGTWRVLDTQGSGAWGWPQAPNLVQHPLVLNANLGSATGAFDGGPHWVPDEAWVTLYVEDANGVVTSQSGYYDHTRSEWRGSDCINGSSGIFSCIRGFERLQAQSAPPMGSISAEIVDGTYRLTGSGESPEGRIVDMYWEVTSQPFDLTAGEGRTYRSRSPQLEVSPELCTIQEVTLYLVDDKGQVGAASYSIPGTGDRFGCMNTGDPERPRTPAAPL